MRFWDSSAILPLVTTERPTRFCLELLREDPRMVVWFNTQVEVFSALHRKRREGTLEEKSFSEARERLATLRRSWSEVLPSDIVRQRAIRLLGVHSLGAADALQLAAALFIFNERPLDEAFVCFDARLAKAAEREGFRVIRS